MLPGDLEDDPVRLRPVARPVHLPAGRRDCRLELDQVLVEARERLGLDRAPGSPQLFPVRHLGDDPGALVADRRAWP